MARTVLVELVDDVDNSPADESVSFGLDGKQYIIDLNAKHATELRNALAKYVSAGTLTSGGTSKRRGRADQDNRPNPSDVRDWAREQGIAVKSRGRVPTDLMVKFQAAQET